MDLSVQEPQSPLARALELLLRVYKEAYEEYTEDTADGIAFEGIVLDDELYNEICQFVEIELREFVDATETAEDTA